MIILRFLALPRWGPRAAYVSLAAGVLGQSASCDKNSKIASRETPPTKPGRGGVSLPTLVLSVVPGHILRLCENVAM